MLGDSQLQTNFRRPVTEFMRADFATVEAGWTVDRALTAIRAHGLGDRIIYFYVTDPDGKLRGVLPARRLLTEPLERRIDEIMISRVVAVPATALLLDACEFFVLYKFYALPVVDAERRILGIVDMSLFTEQVLNMEEKDESADDIFQSLGFHIEELRNATAFKSFRFRFPWLLATILTGSLCAILTQAFAATLEQRIVLAFFMTMVLGLGESVSAQTMAVTLQSLHAIKPDFRWLANALKKELLASAMLGAACATVVGVLVAIWQRDVAAAGAIAFSIVGAMITACLIGLIVPSLLRMMKLDPKIASGPLTLATADVSTLAWYFGTASLVLSR
jgi:magnesium transporter